MTLRKTRKGGKKCGFISKMFRSKHCRHHHHHHHKGGAADFSFGTPIQGGSSQNQGLTNWLWSVSDVTHHSSPPSPKPPSPPTPPAPPTHKPSPPTPPAPPTHKGGRKTRRNRGGLSSQLVPIGLLAGVLASRKKRRYRKGQKSKTRKGRLDFETHKGNKFYNRNNKRQSFNQLGIRRRPF